MKIVIFNIVFVIAILIAPAAVYLPIVPKVSLINVEKVKKPKIKKQKDFTEGLYQRILDVWAYQQSGLWSLFVKAQNTINYHVFNLASEKYSNETLMGNNKVLFDRIYVNDLNGRYLSETPDLLSFAAQIRKFQDLLESHGKQFLVIIHPSKTVMNPDWVADSFKVGEIKPRMLEILEPSMKEAGVNYVKVSEVFTDRKVRYWPASGAHLNSLGKCLSAKALLDYFRKAGKVALPEIHCNYSAEKLTEAKGEDLDLVRLINAWQTWRSVSKVPKVNLQVRSATNESKPSALFVGTSYTFGLLSSLKEAKAFSATDFLFYDKSHYFAENIGQKNERRGKQGFNRKLHSLQFILNHDLIVLETTEARLHQLGFGILNAAEPTKKKKRKK